MTFIILPGHLDLRPWRLKLSTTCQAATVTQVYNKSFDFFTVPIANLQLVADILPVSIPFMVLIFYAFIPRPLFDNGLGILWV